MATKRQLNSIVAASRRAAAQITPEQLPANAVKLFTLYLRDAGNWSGTPLVGGNVTLLGETEDRGLLTYLKRAGLVTTRQDDERRQCYWLSFTEDAGFKFAATLGYAARCDEASTLYCFDYKG